jgi:hypothetical protein
MIPFIGNKAYHWLMYVLKGYQDVPPEFYALQSRARHRMYFELSKFRQQMNQTSHVEPTGDEVLD